MYFCLLWMTVFLIWHNDLNDKCILSPSSIPSVVSIHNRNLFCCQKLYFLGQGAVENTYCGNFQLLLFLTVFSVPRIRYTDTRCTALCKPLCKVHLFPPFTANLSNGTCGEGKKTPMVGYRAYLGHPISRTGTSGFIVEISARYEAQPDVAQRELVLT
jgi:hypothetical protein